MTTNRATSSAISKIQFALLTVDNRYLLIYYRVLEYTIITYFEVRAGAARTCRYVLWSCLLVRALRGATADLLVRAGAGELRRGGPHCAHFLVWPAHGKAEWCGKHAQTIAHPSTNRAQRKQISSFFCNCHGQILFSWNIISTHPPSSQQHTASPKHGRLASARHYAYNVIEIRVPNKKNFMGLL